MSLLSCYIHSHGCNSFISLLLCNLSKGKLITYFFFSLDNCICKGRQKGGKKECKKEKDVNRIAEFVPHSHMGTPFRKLQGDNKCYI
ncbi:unnamed protein product [Trifolium pratense]|uniref:Uncharacterized protein n=1 Tax=Trifolium pratense TaxID=57577 RepID=A0ACB0IZY5_TRIPR|nr:unnamed protein product [Trifolium pratense]